MSESSVDKIKLLNKNQRNILIMIFIIIIILGVSFWVSLHKTIPKIEKKQSSNEITPELLQRMSAQPGAENEEVPVEVLEKMSAPTNTENEEIPKEILEKMSVP